MTAFAILMLCAAAAATAPPTSEADIARILATPYESKMISSGDNWPAIALGKEHRQDILVLLHQGVPAAAIAAHFGWSSEEYATRLDALLENDFVRCADDHCRPTSMVISIEDAKQLSASARSAAERARHVITDHLPEIRARYAKLGAFQDIPFADASFLIVSDVLLDNWQIDNVEKRFVKAPRTERHGKHYYHSLQQKTPDSRVESFGIYGNQMWGNDELMIGIYGNKRRTSPSLLSLDREALAERFALDPTLSVGELRAAIVGQIIGGGELDENVASGLRRLSMMRGDSMLAPVLTPEGYDQLSDLASLVSDDLIAELEAQRTALKRAYESSVYADEISFEEYFIWWYHFFYSALTDRLAQDGTLRIHVNGITTYLVNLSE